MNRAFLIYLAFFMGLIFLATPRGENFKPFLLIDRDIPKEDFAYYFWEHGIKIVLLHIIRSEAKEYRLFFNCIFWFQVIDLIDYWATYNSVWFWVGLFPVSCNTLGFVTLGLILFYDHLWRQWR